MSDLDEELQKFLGTVEEGKANFGDDEQNIIDAWIGKLSEPLESDEEKTVRNEYAQTLARLTTEEKQLLPPFTGNPPGGALTPLADIVSSKTKMGRPAGGQSKKSFQLKKLPCLRKDATRTSTTGAIPKARKPMRPHPFEPTENEFEDYEEMARVIAQSKGQSFAEFVVAISRYSRDYGQGLRTAMKAEVNSFTEYVDHVLSQRIKDLTEVLDREQNAELIKIKRDKEKWQLELGLCKKRIKEIIPDFDIDEYKKDKNYLKKIFAIDAPGTPFEDPFKKWKEESCHRLKWYSDMICKLTRCNEGTSQEICNLKTQAADLEARESMKHQSLTKYLNCEMNEFHRLKCERDRLQKENADLLSELGGME